MNSIPNWIHEKLNDHGAEQTITVRADDNMDF